MFFIQIISMMEYFIHQASYKRLFRVSLFTFSNRFLIKILVSLYGRYILVDCSFQKIAATPSPIPHALVTQYIDVPPNKRWDLCSSPLDLSFCLLQKWCNMTSDRNLKRQYSFPLVYLEYSPLRLSYHAVRKPKQPDREASWRCSDQ